MGFSLFGSSGSSSATTNNTETNTTYETITADSGSVAANGESIVSTGSGPVVRGDGATINMESPEAIAAIREVSSSAINGATNTVGAVAASLKDMGAKLTEAAKTAAGRASTIGEWLPVVGLFVVGLLGFAFLRKGKK